MKILITGGRDYNNSTYLASVLKKLHKEFHITEIIHGDARGADTLAERWGQANNIKTTPYPAKWNKYGKAAGPIRNTEMLIKEKPDLVIAFPGGKGTAHMTNLAETHGFEVKYA